MRDSSPVSLSLWDYVRMCWRAWHHCKDGEIVRAKLVHEGVPYFELVVARGRKAWQLDQRFQEEGRC